MDSNQSQGNDRNVSSRLDAYFAPKEAVSDKQPEPMPSSEQKSAEVPQAPQPEGKEVAPQIQQTVDEEAEALANSKNPERTKSYIDKLKNQLREKEELLTKSQTPQVNEFGTSVFDEFHPQVPQGQVPQGPPVDYSQYSGLNPLQVQNITNQFVDKDGNVDINGLNRALNEANQRANVAAEEARRTREQLTRFEENQQVKEAHAQHPDLDPANKGQFNPQFFNLVRDRLLRNMWEGKKQSLAQVASEIKSALGQSTPVNSTKVAEEAVQQYKETQQNRVQGPIEMGRGEQRQTETVADLRARTRREGFDSPALSSRLNDYFKSVRGR